VITGLAESGVTVFLTTQYLEEADRLAGHVAVLDGGRVVAQGTPAELKRRSADQRLDLVLADADAFDAVARALAGRVIVSDAGERRLGVATDGSAAHVRALLDEVDPGGRAVERFSVHSATLDDVFLALTGHATTTSEPELSHV
jgi:ABC-2 type transport system ATP-binding protein